MDSLQNSERAIAYITFDQPVIALRTLSLPQLTSKIPKEESGLIKKVQC